MREMRMTDELVAFIDEHVSDPRDRGAVEALKRAWFERETRYEHRFGRPDSALPYHVIRLSKDQMRDVQDALGDPLCRLGLDPTTDEPNDIGLFIEGLVDYFAWHDEDDADV
jgi:uncharacterized protein (UPF0248 family)